MSRKSNLNSLRNNWIASWSTTDLDSATFTRVMLLDQSIQDYLTGLFFALKLPSSYYVIRRFYSGLVLLETDVRIFSFRRERGFIYRTRLFYIVIGRFRRWLRRFIFKRRTCVLKTKLLINNKHKRNQSRFISFQVRIRRRRNRYIRRLIRRKIKYAKHYYKRRRAHFQLRNRNSRINRRERISSKLYIRRNVRNTIALNRLTCTQTSISYFKGSHSKKLLCLLPLSDLISTVFDKIDSTSFTYAFNNNMFSYTGNIYLLHRIWPTRCRSYSKFGFVLNKTVLVRDRVAYHSGIRSSMNITRRGIGVRRYGVWHSMIIRCNVLYVGSLVDICDRIVSVSDLFRAFSGDLISFQIRIYEISGFVLNLENSVCNIPLISGSQTSLSIDDLVCSTKKPRSWRVMPSNPVRSCFKIGLRRYSTAPKPPLFGTVTGSDVVLNRTTWNRFSKQPLFQLFMQWYSIIKQIPMNDISVAAPLSNIANNVTEHHITNNTSGKQNAGEDNAHSGWFKNGEKHELLEGSKYLAHTSAVAMKVPSLFLVSTAITAEFHSDIDYINKSIGSVLAGTYTVDSDIVPITHTQVLLLKDYFLHGESKDFLDFVSTKRSKTLGFFIKSRVLLFDTMLKKHSFDSYSIRKFLNIFTFRRIIFSLFTVILFWFMYVCVNVYLSEQLYEACSERLYYVSRLMCEYRRIFNAYALELHVNAVKLDSLSKRVENMAATLNDNWYLTELLWLLIEGKINNWVWNLYVDIVRFISIHALLGTDSEEADLKVCLDILNEGRSAYRMTREQAKTFYYLFEASKKCFVDEIDTLLEMFNTREYIPHIYTFINSVVHSKIYFFSLLLVFFSLINIFFYLFLTSSYFGNSIFRRFVNPDIYLFFTIYFTLLVFCLLPILYPVPVDCFVREFLDKLVSSETHTRLYIFNIGSNVDEYDSKGFDKKLNDNYFLRYFLLDGALQEPSSLVVRGKKVTNWRVDYNIPVWVVHPPRVAAGGEHVAGFVKAPSNEDLYYQVDAYSLKWQNSAAGKVHHIGPHKYYLSIGNSISIKWMCFELVALVVCINTIGVLLAIIIISMYPVFYSIYRTWIADLLSRTIIHNFSLGIVHFKTDFSGSSYLLHIYREAWLNGVKLWCFLIFLFYLLPDMENAFDWFLIVLESDRQRGWLAYSLYINLFKPLFFAYFSGSVVFFTMLYGYFIVFHIDIELDNSELEWKSHRYLNLIKIILKICGAIFFISCYILFFYFALTCDWPIRGCLWFTHF